MTIKDFVAYVKQAWYNKPNTSTPVEASRLLHIENGIKGNSDAIEKIAAAVVSQIVNDPDKIASMAALFSVNQNLANLTNEITSSYLEQGYDLNNFRSIYRPSIRYGWALKNCPYTQGVVVMYLPYQSAYGVQICYTVEKANGFYHQARRVYSNNAWSPWDLDGHAFIRHADYNISILESDWTRSAKGQYYYNHEIDYGIVERSISAQIMQWEAVSTLVDCSFYEDKYIQLRASQATSFKGKVRVVYI